MFTLASRDLTVVDGASVNGTNQLLPRLPTRVVATFVVTTTGAPATFDMRAAIEVSLDGGANWHQAVRFKDVTNAQLLSQIVRGGMATVMGSADLVASVLANAAAAAVLFDLPWPLLARAVTRLFALTGGTAPHVVSSVLLEIA